MTSALLRALCNHLPILLMTSNAPQAKSCANLLVQATTPLHQQPGPHDVM
jgi:hypothetical protein